MMVKKPKSHARQAHEEPEEDIVAEEEMAAPAVHALIDHPEIQKLTSHAHDGSTAHPAMVLPAGQLPSSHTQQTLNPTTIMGEIIRKQLWTAHSG